MFFFAGCTWGISFTSCVDKLALVVSSWLGKRREPLTVRFGKGLNVSSHLNYSQNMVAQSLNGLSHFRSTSGATDTMPQWQPIKEWLWIFWGMCSLLRTKISCIHRRAERSSNRSYQKGHLLTSCKKTTMKSALKKNSLGKIY